MTVTSKRSASSALARWVTALREVAAPAGLTVVAHDVSADRASNIAMATINGHLSRQVAKKIITEDVRRCRYRCRYEEAGQGFASMPDA